MKTHEPMTQLDGEQRANVDQPHPINAEIAMWPAHRAFCREVIENCDCGYVACNQVCRLSEDARTRFDASFHVIPDAMAIKQIHLSRLLPLASLDRNPLRSAQAESI